MQVDLTNDECSLLIAAMGEGLQQVEEGLKALKPNAPQEEVTQTLIARSLFAMIKAKLEAAVKSA